MTRIPSQHDTVPVTPTGNSRRPARLLVIPDFHRDVSPATVTVQAERLPPAEPSPNLVDSAHTAQASAVADNNHPARSAEPAFTSHAPTAVLEPSPPRIDAPVATDSASSLATPLMDAASANSRPTTARWSSASTEGAKHLVAAVGQVRRLVEGLPKRSTLGWQRTILCLVGGAVLAYGATGGWRRDRSRQSVVKSSNAVERQAATEAKIHRLTRAPLRADATSANTPSPPTAVASAPTDSNSNDPIFRMPGIGTRESSAVADEVQSSDFHSSPQSPATEPESQFPVISAPDGSAVSRRMNPQADAQGIHPAPAEAVVAQRNVHARNGADRLLSEPNNSLPQAELVEDRWPDSSRPSHPSYEATTPLYPHTDPGKYRDPAYVVPVITNREPETFR